MKLLELIFLFNSASEKVGSHIKLIPPKKMDMHTAIKTTVNELGLVISTNGNQDVNGVSIHYTTALNATIALITIAMIIDITTGVAREGRNKILDRLGTKNGSFIKSKKIYKDADSENNYMFILSASNQRGIYFQLSIQPK